MPPFDPDKYLAAQSTPTSSSTGTFDPDAYLASKGTEDSADQPSATEAFARSAIPFSAQLAGGVGAAVDKLQGSDSPLLDLYTKYRDEVQKANDAAQAAHPVASTLGKLAGFVPVTMATGGAGAALAGEGILGAAAQGALDAGIMGASDSKADLTKGEVGQFASDVGKSAVGGAALGGLIHGALTPEVLQSSANNLAVKSLKPTATQLRDLGEDGIQKLGQGLLDNKLVTFGSNAQESLPVISDFKQAAGTDLGDVLSQNATNINTENLAQQVRDNVLPQFEKTNLSGPVNTVSGAIDDLASKGELSLNDLNKFGSNVGKIGYNDAGGSAGKAGLRAVERQINDAIEGALPDEAVPEFQDANARYALGKQAEKLAETGASRYAANQGFSLGDKVAAGVGAGVAGPKGLALGLANKLLRERGQSAGAVTLSGMSKVSEMIQNAPQALGPWAPVLTNAAARGSEALAAAHYVLSQNNPQYRTMMENQSDSTSSGNNQ